MIKLIIAAMALGVIADFIKDVREVSTDKRTTIPSVKYQKNPLLWGWVQTPITHVYSQSNAKLIHTVNNQWLFMYNKPTSPDEIIRHRYEVPLTEENLHEIQFIIDNNKL